MEFLCPNHRRQFAELDPKERKDLWLFWMENAYACSEQCQWRDALSLAGSAFDLACLRGTSDGTAMHIELTLSAIVVSRVLSEWGDTAAVERVICRALEHLQPGEGQASAEVCCGLGKCAAVLMDASRHADFFADYLNWPSFPFNHGKRVSLYRTLH